MKRVSHPELATERLVLRDFREDDWTSVHEYAADLEVVRYMPWGPNSEKETKAFIERALASQGEEPRTKFEFAVTLRETGRLIGGCGIRIMSSRDRAANMGYCLRRDTWGRGFAAEAAAAVVAFGFDVLNRHRIHATCDTENQASVRVLEKIGMRREAHFREDTRLRGRWRDSYLYAVLEQEWRGRREAG
jgi:ribosomal-protein-alanine N-acetyltransferase